MTSPNQPRQRVAFIEDAIGTDETLLLTSRLHWIFLVHGLSILGVFVWLGMFLDAYSEKFIAGLADRQMEEAAFLLFKLGNYFEIGCIIIGTLVGSMYLLAYFTTVIGLTTKRLMRRRGVIFVKLDNLDLEEIKGEYVDHGLFGRFLNYGEIRMDARFVANFYVPSIADPYRLMRAMNEARASVGDTVIAGEIPLQEVQVQPVAAGTVVIPAAPAVVIAPQVHHALAPPVVTMRAGDLPPDMPVAVTEVTAAVGSLRKIEPSIAPEPLAKVVDEAHALLGTFSDTAKPHTT